MSVIFILPETKGISLERMDKLFGQVDAVEAGEREAGVESRKLEGKALGDAASDELSQRANAEKSIEAQEVEVVANK